MCGFSLFTSSSPCVLGRSHHLSVLFFLHADKLWYGDVTSAPTGVWVTKEEEERGSHDKHLTWHCHHQVSMWGAYTLTRCQPMTGSPALRRERCLEEGSSQLFLLSLAPQNSGFLASQDIPRVEETPQVKDCKDTQPILRSDPTPAVQLSGLATAPLGGLASR